MRGSLLASCGKLLTLKKRCTVEPKGRVVAEAEREAEAEDVAFGGIDEDDFAGLFDVEDEDEERRPLEEPAPLSHLQASVCRLRETVQQDCPLSAVLPSFVAELFY